MQVPDIFEVEKYQQMKILAKNWKGCNFAVNEHRNFKLSGKVTFLL